MVDDVSAKQAEIHEVTPQSNNVWIISNGICYWEPRFELSAVQCSADITWYPFDDQTCNIAFQSWSLWYDEVNVTGHIGIEYYIPSDEWNLTCACS